MPIYRTLNTDLAQPNVDVKEIHGIGYADGDFNKATESVHVEFGSGDIIIHSGKIDDDGPSHAIVLTQHTDGPQPIGRYTDKYVGQECYAPVVLRFSHYTSIDALIERLVFLKGEMLNGK